MIASDRPRERLANRRAHDVHMIVHDNMVITAGLGAYGDGRIGEVFVSVAKVGTSLEALGHDAATILSIALQYGAPLSDLRHALSRDETGHPQSLIGAVLDLMAEVSPEPHRSLQQERQSS